MTDQLASLYPASDSSRLIVSFESFVEPDRHAQLEEDVADAAAGIRSVNEIRADRGYQNAQSEWGQLPIQPASNRPFDGDEPPQPAAVPGAEYRSDGSRAEGSPPSRVEVQDRLTPEKCKKREERYHRRWTPQFESRVRSIFAIEKTAIMKNFSDLPDSERIKAEDPQQARANPDDELNMDEAQRLAGLLYPANSFAELYRSKLGPMYTSIWEDVAEETLDIISSPKRFEMTQRAASWLQEEPFALAHYREQDAQKVIAKSLAKSLTEGQSGKEAAKALRKVLNDDFSSASVTRIAQTEIASAITQSQIDGYEQSGVVDTLTWETSFDRAVRPSHAAAQGQRVQLGSLFTLGSGERCNGPADNRLTAADRINCRCYTTAGLSTNGNFEAQFEPSSPSGLQDPKTLPEKGSDLYDIYQETKQANG